MQKFDIKDFWREKFPNLKSFTWNNKACTAMSRIDYWLASCSLQKENILINILPMPLTDHKAVSFNVSLQSFSSNNYNSYWKLNNSILDNESVKVTIRSLIAQYWKLAQRSNDYCNYWELLKFEIGKFLRNYGNVLAKARKHEEEIIISKIIAFTQRSPPIFSDDEKIELIALQKHLDDIYKRRAEGAFIRSRQRWLEKGEQNSAYFFQLEKSHSKNSISHLNINGIVTHDPRSIADYCSSFYSSLYESRFNEKVTLDFLDSLINTKSVSEGKKELCDNPICIEEVLHAIKELKLNKSPGVDGLISEFYKSFSEELAPFLLKFFSQSIELGKLPPTLTQGLITLIPKPKKDALLLDNWRPICLLNIDYKILASIFSVRIKKTLDLIIDDTQSGFMRNRHISNNIRLVLDLIDYPHLYSDKSFFFRLP
ncbi:putative 149 kDa protein [Labeo rohita]|uniref:149 kDa protein n=1 Tax=Labeo rohita TaxID=84645 RepID=A0ABQ8KZA4_LABRO|nr:putative 149 kDa protein [Labeo rohita]